jgi:hypothetical protein
VAVAALPCVCNAAFSEGELAVPLCTDARARLSSAAAVGTYPTPAYGASSGDAVVAAVDGMAGTAVGDETGSALAVGDAGGGDAWLACARLELMVLAASPSFAGVAPVSTGGDARVSVGCVAAMPGGRSEIARGASPLAGAISWCYTHARTLACVPAGFACGDCAVWLCCVTLLYGCAVWLCCVAVLHEDWDIALCL